MERTMRNPVSQGMQRLPVVGNLTFKQERNGIPAGMELYLFDNKTNTGLTKEQFNDAGMHVVSYGYSYFRAVYPEKGQTNIVRGKDTTYKFYRDGNLVLEGKYETFKDHSGYSYCGCMFVMTSKGNLLRLMMSSGIVRGSIKEILSSDHDFNIPTYITLEDIVDYKAQNGNTYKQPVFKAHHQKDQGLIDKTIDMNNLVMDYYDEKMDGGFNDPQTSEGSGSAEPEPAVGNWDNVAWVEKEMSGLADVGQLTNFWRKVYENHRVSESARESKALIQKRIDLIDAKYKLNDQGSFDIMKLNEMPNI